jgi:phospholipase/carboxylesterase
VSADIRVLAAGAPLERAKAAVVLLHGRGGSAEDILTLAGALAVPDIAYVAPQAPGNTWYPQSFLAPLERNEPALSRSLGTVRAVVDGLVKSGLTVERIVLMGFSQGGCLAMEYGARNARRYGGLVGLSSGLIGPPGSPRDYAGSLAGTPVFLGCSDSDSHIPEWRVHESTEVLRGLGAEVTERIYPGMGHTINDDEIAQVRRLMSALA